MPRVCNALFLGGLLLLPRLLWPAEPMAQPPAVPTATVSLYNDARVDEPTLIRAQQVAARIFEQSGVTLVWVDCWKGKLAASEKAFCQRPQLSLRIVPHARGLSDDPLGAAFLGPDGTGCYGDVFLDRIVRMQQDDPGEVAVAELLGYVAAHEIGHLLGLQLHSPSGIMRARWEHAELHQAAMGALRFTHDQARWLRARSAALHLASGPAVDWLAASSP